MITSMWTVTIAPQSRLSVVFCIKLVVTVDFGRQRVGGESYHSSFTVTLT